MLDSIKRVSLRTRLALLAALALFALLVAMFVAWRLARATETFALRQAESAVNAAARELAGELSAHPDGYHTPEQAAPPPPHRPLATLTEGSGTPAPRPHPVPPHVSKLFAAYTDPLARLTAITLHRFPDMAGGFYRARDDAPAGYAFPDAAGTAFNQALPAAEAEAVRALARQATETGVPVMRTWQSEGDRIVLAAYPAQTDGRRNGDADASSGATSANGITAAWALRRLSRFSGATDYANLFALSALAVAIAAVSGLAFTTVRDLQHGVNRIETGLAELELDLATRVREPHTPELARIAGAINELAANLRANLERQRELERELRQNERLSALGRLVAGVAHEVRNPLAAIKLKIQLARRAALAPDKLDATFRVIMEEIERLDALVRRLLELGRAPSLRLTTFDLCALAHRRAAIFTDLATRAGVQVVAETSLEQVAIEGDEDRLAQVVDNLLQNALAAMPDGGRLTLNCEAARAPDGAPTARLIITDTGHGIAEDERAHIFEPFYTGRAAGTGLGLAIAREIVEAHGGRINFESRAGSGTRFLIELPRRAATPN